MLLWALFSCGLLFESVLTLPVTKTVAEVLEDSYGQRSSERLRKYDPVEVKWEEHHHPQLRQEQRHQQQEHHHHQQQQEHRHQQTPDFMDVITDYTHVGKPGVVQPVQEEYSISMPSHIESWEEHTNRRLDQLPSAASNTGLDGDDFHFASAPPLPGKRYPTKDEGHGKYPKDEPYRPSGEEVREWDENRNAKQKMFLQKYQEMDESWSETKGTGWDLDMKRGEDKKGQEKGEGWVNINNDYYSQSQKVNGFQPKKYFYDFYNHNISKTDIANINYNLMEKGSLDYNVLRATPHGRHLLFLSLLEDSERPSWKPRCKGRMRLFLPDSLKAADQPPTPKNVIVLRDIVSHGRLVSRKELLTKFRKRPIGLISLDEEISRFNLTHGEAVRSMLELVLGQETFDSTLSLLVTLKEFVNKQMFLDSVLTVIDTRDDVGFVIPSFTSVKPRDYFQIDNYMKLHEDSEQSRRHKRQAPGRRNQGLGRRGSPQTWRISWGDGPFRTLPESDPESKLFYFREDPMVNAHHLHWHLKMSNRQVPDWHPSHGLNMDRRGEMFYFMHKQMLSRYNVDRVALGLDFTKALSSEFWDQPLSPGYDSRLTQASGRPYPPRPSGATIPDPADMFLADRSIKEAIQNGVILSANRPHRLGYAQGVDFGIDALGNALEAFEPSPITGNLHNDGHQKIGEMHRGPDLGVMGNPNGAVRDPLFFNWHKHIDDLHQIYKNMLPAYGDEDLSFPGVNITAAHVQSSRGDDPNRLFTFMETSSIRLQSLDLRSPEEMEDGSVNVVYDRLNHVPFAYHVNIQSTHQTHGLLRIFLIPADITLPSDTEVTQVSIEMDRFLVFMNEGDNYFVRESTRSPFVTRSPLPLGELQDRLLQGDISDEEFNWSGCGWPETLVLPRGREGGMKFRLYMMISQVLPEDSAMTSNWERMQFTSWSWCGVRRNEGDVPDSRPMGFPLDRNPPNGNWQSLMYSGATKRANHISRDVTISHDPIGSTTSRGRENQRRNG